MKLDGSVSLRVLPLAGMRLTPTVLVHPRISQVLPGKQTELGIDPSGV